MQPVIDHFPTLLFLFSLDFGCVCCLLHKERPLNELESFIDETRVLVSESSEQNEVRISRHLHHGRTNGKHRLPFGPVQRQDGEESLQERRVKQGEVQRH